MCAHTRTPECVPIVECRAQNVRSLSFTWFKEGRKKEKKKKGELDFATSLPCIPTVNFLGRLHKELECENAHTVQLIRRRRMKKKEKNKKREEEGTHRRAEG